MCGFTHGPIAAERGGIEMQIHIMTVHGVFDNFT